MQSSKSNEVQPPSIGQILVRGMGRSCFGLRIGFVVTCLGISQLGCQTFPMPGRVSSDKSLLKPQTASASNTITQGNQSDKDTTGPVDQQDKAEPGSKAAPLLPVASQSATPAAGASATIRGQSPGVNRYRTENYQVQPTNPPEFPQSTSDATIFPPAGPVVAPNSRQGEGVIPPPTGTLSSPGAATSVGPPAVNGFPQSSTGLPPVPPPTTGSGFGYGADSALASPSDYGSAIAPGVTQFPNNANAAIAPGAIPYVPEDPGIGAPGDVGYRPRERIAPIDVFVQEARTGRIILGGSVNSDLGVAGQLIIDERNFNIRRLPRSWDDIRSGRAFRGGGQNFRMELMPGNRVERYTVSWTERNLLGYLPYSLSVGGFYYTRQFRDWTEQRLGGRIALGYEVTKDLAASAELRMEDVKLFDPRIAGVSELDSALGSNDLYTARFRVAKDTRDSPFMSTEGALLELVFDQVFGEYDYQRGQVNYSRYFKVRERPDGTGRHVIASTWRFGFTGSQTPIFENYFAGGYSTLRGFSFRGAGPVVGDVQVGGEFMALGSLEYVFPITADDMLRGVAFVDYGTIEQDIELNSENFRVAPGLGLRVTVPALGPAPLAFDFAYPINHADTDDRQIFSFFMGFTR